MLLGQGRCECPAVHAMLAEVLFWAGLRWSARTPGRRSAPTGRRAPGQLIQPRAIQACKVAANHRVRFSVPSSPVRVAAVLGLTASLLFLLAAEMTNRPPMQLRPLLPRRRLQPVRLPRRHRRPSPSRSRRRTTSTRSRSVEASASRRRSRSDRPGRSTETRTKVLEPGKGPVVGEGQVSRSTTTE